MNEPGQEHVLQWLSGLTVAEEFRDHGGKDGEAADIMFFIDNIFRFTQAGSEVSALLDVCLLPWVISLHWQVKWGQMQERITSTKRGSITSVQSVYACRRLDRPCTCNNIYPP